MVLSKPHKSAPVSSLWPWPEDDSRPVWVDRYYTLAHRKQGLSRVDVARELPDDSLTTWENRESFPIRYLFKYGLDALSERLYYRLARFFDLPQQHVYWGVSERFPLWATAAIQYEAEAYFPRRVDEESGTVTYRRRRIPITNASDFTRHALLHALCGSGDINQAMVKGDGLFGIDAADCSFTAPPGPDRNGLWARWREKCSEPVFQTLLEMAARVAAAGEETLTELVRAEVLSTPWEGFLTCGEARMFAAADAGDTSWAESSTFDPLRKYGSPEQMLAQYRQTRPELFSKEIMAEKLAAGFGESFREMTQAAETYLAG